MSTQTTLAAIHLVLVPAGAEHQAVVRALSNAGEKPIVVAIPAGPTAFQAFLEAWKDRPQWDSPGILLVGLGGSLSPKHPVGEAVLLQSVWDSTDHRAPGRGCDRTLTQQLSHQLGLPIGTGVTCDRIITTVAEKRRLGDRYQADIVDMESAILLKSLPQARIAVIRIISDDCDHDLPDIGDAIRPDGTLNPLRLTTGFLKQPIAALKFVRNSLQALKHLEQLMQTLMAPNSSASS
jgi:hypothetical protein